MGNHDHSALNKKIADLENRLKKKDAVIESLESSEKHYENIVESSPQGIITLDLTGKVIYCNEPFLNITGYERDEIVNRHFTKLPTLRKQDLNFHKELFAKLIKGKVRDPYEFTWVHNNGSIRIGEAFISLLKDNNRKIIGLQVLLSDITLKKEIETKLKDSEKKYRKLFELESDMIALIDVEKGDILEANKAFEVMYGYSRNEILKMKNADFSAEPEKTREATASRLSKVPVRYHKKKDGTVFPVEIMARILEYKGRDVQIAAIRDISERIRVEESLRNSEKKYREIIESSVDWIWELDSKGKYTFSSPKVKDLIGYEPEELLNKTPFDLMPPEEAKRIGEFFNKTIADRRPVERLEKTVLHKDGHEKVLETSGIPIIDENNKLIGFKGINRDITDRHKVEAALKESEQRLRVLVEGTNSCILFIEDRMIRYANEATCRTFGFSLEELIDNSTLVFHVSPQKYNEAGELVYAALQKGKAWRGEWQYKTKDERILWMDTNITSLDSGGVVAVLNDITAKKKYEEELHELSSLVEQAKESFIKTDNNFIITYMNKAAEELFGWKKSELIGKTPDILNGEKNKEKIQMEIYDAVNSGQTYTGEFLNIRKDGSQFICSMRISPLYNKDGGVIGYLGIQQDVTERRKVEMALKESEGRFKEIFRNLGMGVAVYEAVDGCKDFIFKEINDAGAKINRISRENTIGKRLLSLFPGVKELGLFDVLVKVHKTGKPEHLPLEFYEDNRLNLWVDNYIFQLPSGDIVAVYNDLTAQKRAEEEKGLIVDQLYHAQKMESIGRLAGGIAHDFNNLLVGIMGYAELLKMQYPDKTSTEGEAAEVILNSAERASALTVQLLGFARKGKFNPVPLNINDILRNTVKVSEKIFEKNIKISFDLGTEVKLIEADLHQIEQVLTNLFINAKDAMPKGGILTLKTNNKKVETGINCLCGNSEPGEYVVVDVTDTGIGIPDEIVENIFEPFFTTKGEGKGTGLGLATVYGIITNHGGHLSVTSEPGKGTSIIISLPVSGKKVKAKKKDKKLIRGTGRILIIDDEKNVRQYTEAMLRRMGYEVILAEDGSEGVKIYKKNKDIIDLVLLDMIMPVKSGKETLAEMQKVKPDVRVVLFSGYSKEGQAEEIMKKGVKGFIQKPFSAEQLSKTVKKAIKA